MQIARFLAGAALITAPIAVASGQGASNPDSSSGHNAAKWIGGTGAVGGAALFLAFANSGNSANRTLAPSIHTATPGHDSSSPAPTNTPPAPLPPATNTTPPAPPAPSAPATVPADTTATVDTPPDAPTGPVSGTDESPFIDQGTPPPHTYTPLAPQAETPSTVPEPGSLALTATGIIGLVPLIRRRRR